ncbi:MAG: hypothetical protein QOH03_3969 [Kribbellaceae bacterium]|nr:hypothetical protein [Kribbellaceae bacterium]
MGSLVLRVCHAPETPPGSGSHPDTGHRPAPSPSSEEDPGDVEPAQARGRATHRRSGTRRRARFRGARLGPAWVGTTNQRNRHPDTVPPGHGHRHRSGQPIERSRHAETGSAAYPSVVINWCESSRRRWDGGRRPGRGRRARPRMYVGLVAGPSAKVRGLPVGWAVDAVGRGHGRRGAGRPWRGVG